MSDKIINDIDVSECEHHYTNPVNGIIYHGCAIYEQINELGYSQDTLCEQNPNCYYKQLKRLQKENEELKARFNELYNNAEQLVNKYNKYGGNKENELVEIINKTTDKRNKYKQTLEEIRENLIKLKTNDEDDFCYEFSKLQSKINEVLNDRD